jgi:branched-chain amino acid transport system substrate-binding protein
MLMRILLSASVFTVATGAALAQTREPVKIGVLDDMTSVYADLTGESSVTAARMAVEDFGGEVLGRPIEVVIADHLNKADNAASIARKWFDLDNVEMITGLGNSAVALAVQGVANEKMKIDIVTGAATSDLTGKACSPTGFHWVYDTYSLAKTTGTAVVKTGGDSWFFITADYSFGTALQRDTTQFIEENGGRVLGAVRSPINTADFSSFLLQAQSSKAKVVGLALAGNDMINAIKGASEFGLTKGGQRLAALLAFITDVNAIGLQNARELVFSETFYWDTNEETRAWARRFFERRKLMPNSLNAGTYTAVLHYLEAVQVVGTLDGSKVAAAIKAMPINDVMSKNGKVREDGRAVRDTYLYQVKAPAESQSAWDYFKLVGTVPGDQAFRPLAAGDCPLVRAR